MKELDDIKVLSTFGIRLEKLINSSQYSVYDIAENTGLSCRAVYTWTRGYRMPTAITLRRVCLLLGCSADYLLGLKDET